MLKSIGKCLLKPKSYPSHCAHSFPSHCAPLSVMSRGVHMDVWKCTPEGADNKDPTVVLFGYAGKRADLSYVIGLRRGRAVVNGVPPRPLKSPDPRIFFFQNTFIDPERTSKNIYKKNFFPKKRP